MKILRLAGLLVVLLALGNGAFSRARATGPFSCWKYCDNHFYSGQCWDTLERCCQFDQNCPDPYTWVDGDCSDGVNHCPWY